jgi:hypothetical protein
MGGLGRGWGEVWGWTGLRFGGGVYGSNLTPWSERDKKGPLVKKILKEKKIKKKNFKNK